MDSQERLNKILDAVPKFRDDLTAYEEIFKRIKQTASQAAKHSRDRIPTFEEYLFYLHMCNKYDKELQSKYYAVTYTKFTKQQAEETEKELGIEGLSQYFGN